MMKVINRCRLSLLWGLSSATLAFAPLAWAQQDMNSVAGATIDQSQRIITGPNRIESGNSVTVKTGQIWGFNAPPLFCLFNSDCKVPTISLAVEYRDSPEQGNALEQTLLNKYFYKAKDSESKDVPTLGQQITIKTVYFGSVDGYRNLLAKNNRDKAVQDAKNNASDLVGLAAYVLTKGASQPQGQASNYKVITDKEVATLPAGPEKILVTQIEFKRGLYSEPVAVHETLTAAYSDMSEQQLRKINFEDGVKPVLRVEQ